MIKALFLIFESEAAWDRVALSRRGLGSIVAFYLLPMMLMVAVAEGCSLVLKGRPQHGTGEIKLFTPAEAVLSGMMELLLMGVVIVVCARLVKAVGETFRSGNTYTQTFKVVIFGLSPMFLCRLLDVAPTMNLWIPWGLGMLLCVKILYHGVPRVMQPDPPQAFGLFVMSTLLIAMVTGAERFITAGYLNGSFKPLAEVITQTAAKLHF